MGSHERNDSEVKREANIVVLLRVTHGHETKPNQILLVLSICDWESCVLFSVAGKLLSGCSAHIGLRYTFTVSSLYACAFAPASI